MSASTATFSSGVPELRVRVLRDAPVREGASFVLYWMIANRRVSHNFALDRAIEWARHLRKPLIVFEPLRIAYPWASDRLHCFVIEGMFENKAALEDSGAVYYPYVEPSPGADKGLLVSLAERAAVVVTDEYPCFFLPRMVAAASEKMTARMEAIDSNGVLPLAATERVFPTAYSFRRFLQQMLADHLSHVPKARPFAGAPLVRGALPQAIVQRWPKVAERDLEHPSALLSRLPIDHAVAAVPRHGGTSSARARLRRFVSSRLGEYRETRNEPGLSGTSGLSPYLHFGHLAAHEVFAAVARSQDWTLDSISEKPSGRREGFWNMDANAEAFLDQVLTWRELGFNMCHKRQDYDAFDSLPAWAKATLTKHERDPRPHLYARHELESARTHDDLWNAAQRQLVRDGWFHNYMRMLWGKKILEWSPSPREALATMVELMNKYSLDGRDPCSYTGFFWTLGRYDRPWGPERPIFGTIRYMSSENTRRKLDVDPYLAAYREA